MSASDTYARFYDHPKLNVAKSREQGNPVYEDAVYIEIMIKGDSNTSFSREMKDADKEMYPKEWKEYETGTKIEETGTPLNYLPNISPATQMNLNATGITTVEDLAELDDSKVLGIRGMVDLRKRAIAYVKALTVDNEAEKPKRRGRPKKHEPTHDSTERLQ